MYGGSWLPVSRLVSPGLDLKASRRDLKPSRRELRAGQRGSKAGVRSFVRDRDRLVRDVDPGSRDLLRRSLCPPPISSPTLAAVNG